jgi:thymidylate synthase
MQMDQNDLIVYFHNKLQKEELRENALEETLKREYTAATQQELDRCKKRINEIENLIKEIENQNDNSVYKA